ncbi:hypothetical protein [Paludisphaera mucosa]|uniref:Phage holin family protein n=1 Tax=Paludisphaera mucosa TaxID=3030827 RepID=A0ABT6FGU3_9BACT|nr:hypothetical protein [Paludisphaera mucosa]MDG3006792.1 hypothetical protein [Paludisphaera mucosa]
MPNPDSSFLVLACLTAVWIVLVLASFLLLYRGGDSAFKRRWFRSSVLQAGLLVYFFSLAMTILSPHGLGVLSDLIWFVPAVCLISWLDNKHTKFCDGCGATVYQHNGFSEARCCSKCGARIDWKPDVRDDPLD